MGFFDNFIKNVQEIDDRLAGDVSFKCSSCGATVTGKANKKSLQCEFCGNFENNPHYKSHLEGKPAGAIFGGFENNSNSNSSSVFDEDIEEDDFDSMRRNRGFGRDRKFDRPVYAYIEKSGLFFSGEIPGMNFSKVTLCKSYKECVDKLKEKYYKEKSGAFYKPPVQDIDEIERQHPDAKIISLD